MPIQTDQREDFAYSPPASTARRADTRKFRRYGAAVAMILAPLCVWLVHLTIPVLKPASEVPGGEMIAGIAADPGAERLTLAFSVAASLLFPLAVVGLMRLVSRRCPVLGTVGGGMALVGWALLPFLVVSDAVAYEMSRLDPGSTQLAQLWDRLQANPVIVVFTAVFVVAHVLGTALLGIGLGRGRLVPPWAAVAVVVGSLLHPVAIMVFVNRPLVLLAHTLTIAGLVPAAAATLRMSDDEWDLLPTAA